MKLSKLATEEETGLEGGGQFEFGFCIAEPFLLGTPFANALNCPAIVRSCPFFGRASTYNWESEKVRPKRTIFLCGKLIIYIRSLLRPPFCLLPTIIASVVRGFVVKQKCLLIIIFTTLSPFSKHVQTIKPN